MPLIQKRPTVGQRSDLLSTRKGTLSIAAAVALLAAAILLVFLNQYRNSVADEGEPAKVLVADQLIPQGSSGDVVTAQSMLRSGTVRKDQLAAGAVVDPAALRGKVAAKDILPGQQLVAADFVAAGDTVQSRLGPTQRALAVPVDDVHGLVGPVRAGDRVDVFVAFSAEGNGGTTRALLKTLLNNVLVLRAPTVAEGGESSGSSVVLRVPGDMAPEVAFAADHGKLWLIGRPAAGAQELRPETVDIDKVLAGQRALGTNGRSGR